jgi:hypothetical protein
VTRVLGLVLRVFSFLFHFPLIAFLLLASGLAWFNGHNLIIEVLPWQGAALTYVLFFSALAGLLSLGLALAQTRTPRVPFVVWNLAVLAVLARGYFFSSYGFGPGGGSLSTALSLSLAAFAAVVGSWLHWRAARRG